MVNWGRAKGLSELAESASTLERIGEDVRGLEGAGNIADALHAARITEGVPEKLQSLGKLSKVLKNGESLKVAGKEDNCLSKMFGAGRELRITGKSGQETVNIITKAADGAETLVEDETILRDIGTRMKKTLEGIDSLSEELRTIINEGQEDAEQDKIAEISIRLDPDIVDLPAGDIKEKAVLERMDHWTSEQETFNETEVNFLAVLKHEEIQSEEDIVELMRTMERINRKKTGPVRGGLGGARRAAESFSPEKLEDLFKIKIEANGGEKGLSIEEKQRLIDIFKAKSNLAIESTPAVGDKQKLQKGVMRMLNTHSEDLKTLFPSSGDSDPINTMKVFLTEENDFKNMKNKDFNKLSDDERGKFRAFQQYQENNAERRQLAKELNAENPPTGKNDRNGIFNKDGKFIGDDGDIEAMTKAGVDPELLDSAREDLNIEDVGLPNSDEFKSFEAEGMAGGKGWRAATASAGVGIGGLIASMGPVVGAVLGFVANAALNNAATLAIISGLVAFFSKCPEIVPVWLKKLIIYINDNLPEADLVIGDIATTFRNDPLVKPNTLIIEAIIFCLYIFIILWLSWPNIFGTITFFILFTPIYALCFLGSAESILSNDIGNLWDNKGVIFGSSDSTYTPGENGISQDCFEYSFYLFIPTIIMFLGPPIGLFINKCIKKYHLFRLRRDNQRPLRKSVTDYSGYYSSAAEMTEEMSEMMKVEEMDGGGISNFKSLFILKKFNKYLPYLLLIIMISIFILNKKYRNLSHIIT
jgi:hypothetical protein